MKNTCYIIGAGSFDGLMDRPSEKDLVIAADGGYVYLEQLGICPHVLLGDFDSLELVPEHEHLIRHSPIKDDTDMALAAAYGLDKGYRRFCLYGGLGGRLDHTIANLQLLTNLSRQGAEAYLIGEDIIATAVTDERLYFDESARGMISVFCAGEIAEQVWEKGLKYKLSDAVLTCDRALGVSNEFVGVRSSIETGRGSLLILWNRENGFPKKREAVTGGT